MNPLKKYETRFGLELIAIPIIIILANIQQCQGQEYVYAEIAGSTKMTSAKMVVNVDFGETYKNLADNKDSTGKAIVFSSMVDALNYMVKKKWDFVTAYGNIETGGFYRYVIRKPMNEFTEDEKARLNK